MTVTITKKKFAFQNEEKRKRAAELIFANKEIVFYIDEKEKRAAELVIAEKELARQNKKTSKITAELQRSLKEALDYKYALEESSIVAITDQKGVIRYANDNFCKISKYDREELIGQDHRIINSAFHPKEFIRDLWVTIANGNIWKGEIKNKAKDGTIYWVDTTIVPFLNEQGKPYQYIAIRSDITERKRVVDLSAANKALTFQSKENEKRAAELSVANNKELAFQNEEKEKRAAELLIANKELVFQNQEKEKRAAELIVANKELAFQNEEKEKRAAELLIANKELVFQNQEKEKRTLELINTNKVLEQFAYVASHDLQEPLRTVSNYMKVFEEDYLKLLDVNAMRYIHSINNATKRMSSLIKSLLDFSRLGRNTKLVFSDCRKIIDDVLADIDTVIKGSNAVIEVFDMPQLNIFEIEIGQLFQNLITNAIKFRRENTQPKIIISSEQIENAWRFSVSDNGIGIDSAYFQRIFDIFQQLETTKKHEGSGIGLANCKRIVQLHKGEIWVESIPEQGTTFYFTLSNLIL
jgi:PAS domain S-box-containing protein